MNLSISTSQQKSYNSNNRYKGTYLHGQLETDMGFDIFSFDQETDFDEGIHLVNVNDRECFFIVWHGNLEIDEYRGYLIYSDDEQLGFCIKSFLEKPNFI